MITALSNLPAVPLLVLGLVVAAVMVVARRRSAVPVPRLLLLGATLLAVGAVLVIALRVQPVFDPAAAFRWQPDGPIRFVTDFAVSAEIRLNVLLLVPACLLATVLTRRPLLVTTCGIALAALCECVQGASHSGVPDGSDVLAGGLGAVLGGLVGALVLVVRDIRRPSRRVLAPAALLGVLVVGLLALMPLAAAGYQARYAEDLRTRLAPITYDDVVTWGHGTAHVAELDRRVWGAGWNRSSANRYLPDAAQVLYPSSFLLVRQCVLATWTPAALTVEPRTGSVCASTWG